MNSNTFALIKRYNAMKLKLNTFLTIMVLSCWLPYSYAQVLEQDSLALVAFYNSTGGPNWNNNTGWLEGPVDSWYGVTVENNRVKKIILNSNNLFGTLPPELGQLGNLYTIAFSNDSGLTGELPPELFQISSLRQIGIGNCSLTGSIPNNIWNCTYLFELNLSENNFSGPIPSEIGNLDSLIYLDLHNNQLVGQMPPSIGNCKNLLDLRLNNNMLSSNIPSSLANCNHVKFIDLSNNLLEGDIPNELAQVTSYTDLFFHNNHLTGIPPWNYNWMLNFLWIQNNKMTFEDIEPHFVGYMGFSYCPQDSMQTRIDTILQKGNNFNIYSGTLGEYTEYYWMHDGQPIPGTLNDDTLKLTNLSESDAGTYICYAQSSKCLQPNGMPMVLIRRPVNINITVGIDEGSKSYSSHISPNPGSEEITVSTDFTDCSFELYDITGRILITQELHSGNTLIVTNTLEDGVYLYSIRSGNRIVGNGKWVKR
jgi:hypothetical protein